MIKSTFLGAGIFVVASWAYIRHIQLPIGPSRMKWGPLVFGHRGCRNIPGIPENTIEALEYAKSNGAKGVEVDIRLSKDNQLVVYHDAVFGKNMSNCDNPATRVDQLDLIDIKSLIFTSDPSKQVRIPTLEEVILYCKDNNLKLLIEIKEIKRVNICILKLIELYKKYQYYMYIHTIVISFSPFSLYKVRNLDRDIAVGMLYTSNLLRGVVKDKIDILPWYVRLFPTFFDKVLFFGQTKLSPWIIGISTICPHYSYFSEDYKKLWFKRNISIYLWGFENPSKCTEEMRVSGIIVSADDNYDEFLPVKKELTYESVFPDAPSNSQPSIAP